MKFNLTYLLLLLIFGCTGVKTPSKSSSSARLPTEIYVQASIVTPEIKMEGQRLKIGFKNQSQCPIRYNIEADHPDINERLAQLGTIELEALSDTTVTLEDIPEYDSDIAYKYSWKFGSTSKKVTPIKLALPFPKGKKHTVIQGNNTNHTHNTEWSRFAVDFDLKINDTICSATSGFVVGVIDQYKYGGIGNKWKPYGNFITIYEPNSGVFTQYVHLVENGSFVKVGDEVKQGQSIGLSGMTGQTDVEHLHFNCLIPTDSENGLKSTSFEFIGGYKSTGLKRGDVIEHN